MPRRRHARNFFDFALLKGPKVTGMAGVLFKLSAFLQCQIAKLLAVTGMVDVLFTICKTVIVCEESLQLSPSLMLQIARVPAVTPVVGVLIRILATVTGF